jgi:hypothetical protein
LLNISGSRPTRKRPRFNTTSRSSIENNSNAEPSVDLPALPVAAFEPKERLSLLICLPAFVPGESPEPVSRS